MLRLLREKVAGTPLMDRVAAVYPVGWPISVEHDLPRLPLPACAAPDQPACLVTWASFAKEADPGMLLEQYRTTPGLDGALRGDSPILCVNPLTGSANGQADMAANQGTLVPGAELNSGDLVPGAVPVAWKQWPGMAMNPGFDQAIQAAAAGDKPLVLLCRSGVRSIAAAKRATELGLTAYNILEGFEGDPDTQAHRNRKGGWRHQGLPWRQN